MNDYNPYAPPRASVSDHVSTKCTREGKFVLVPVGSDLPARCIKCNEPAVTPIKKRKVYWHHPLLYLLILINIVFYAVVALFVRKKAKVSPGLCKHHSSARKKTLALLLTTGAGMMLASLLLDVPGLELAKPALLLFGFLFIIVALIKSQTVTASKITNTTIKLKGCSEPFLSSLDYDI